MTAENNPDLPKKSRLSSKASLSGEGLEFNFETESKPARMEKSTIPTDPEMLYDLQSMPSKPADTGGVNRLSFASQEKKFYRPESSASKTSTPSNPMPTLSPSPTISDFRKNADRQRREQKSVTSLLSGVAYALIGGILLVAILAGFGGYVLYKQIQNQAVTVAQLNDKLDGQIAALKIEQEQFKKFATDQAAFDVEVKEKLGKISAAADRTSAALRDEKESRAKDLAAIQKRLGRLENRRASMPPGE